MIKYLSLIVMVFIFVSCTIGKDAPVAKKYGLIEDNITLSEYIDWTRGEGENIEMPSPILLETDWQYRHIKEITITHRAKDNISIDGGDTTCKSFNPTKKELKRYFYLASKITLYDRLKLLNSTDCYIGGNVTFEDGEKAKWTLDTMMVGTMKRKKKKENILYCPQCRYVEPAETNQKM